MHSTIVMGLYSVTKALKPCIQHHNFIDDVARSMSLASCQSLCFCLKVCLWCSQIQMYGSTLFHDPCLYTAKQRASAPVQIRRQEVYGQASAYPSLSFYHGFTILKRYYLLFIIYIKFHQRIQKSVSVTAQINSLSHYNFAVYSSLFNTPSNCLVMLEARRLLQRAFVQMQSLELFN